MNLHMLPLLAAAGLVAATSLPAQGRQQIRIVGSSTVYPFSSYVAEEFGATTGFKTPVVESTGSGGGHKLFAAGLGSDHPDITNSSRRMKPSELEANQENGIGEVIEVKIGFDGIAFCQNKDNDAFDVTVTELVLAVAAEVPSEQKSGDGDVVLVPNPYRYWDEINPKLPHRKIFLLGPPTTSGTRDAFHELVMHVGTAQLGYPTAEDGSTAPYDHIRQDGAWVDSGENDNLIVQKLTRDKVALGVFGYSFLIENRDRIKGSLVNGVAPTPETISSGAYPVSRSMYFYVKAKHIGMIPGIAEFVGLFLSDDMIGPDGELCDIGLIPLPESELRSMRDAWKARRALKLEDLYH